CQCRTRITNPIARIRSLARCLSRGAKRLCGGEKISGHIKLTSVFTMALSPTTRRFRTMLSFNTSLTHMLYK
ncbi:unnamed protein product, partial [Brassica rapa]